MRALFLTWDGPQQSYLESLFFPIFAGLRRHGVDVHTLQLTWARPAQLEPVRAAAERLGTAYASRRIPEAARKLALPAVVAYGALAAQRFMAARDIGTLFPRSLIPMSMALLLRQARAVDLLFDADGFMADERIDFGGWNPQSPQYRLLRHVEAQGAREARALICRTEQAKRILLERAFAKTPPEPDKIFVAPNAKDAASFTPGSEADRAATRQRHGIAAGAPWLVYVGSIGPQYCPELMLATFAEVVRRRPDARLSCFTMHPAALERLLRGHSLPSGSVHVAQAPPAEVPAILAASDLGLALRLESFSQRGICPIKVAEYLLCGVPLVSSHVGDLEAQLGGDRAVMLVDPARPAAAVEIAAWFVEAVLPERAACRQSARALGLKWFELERCIETYAKMFHYPAEPRAA